MKSGPGLKAPRCEGACVTGLKARAPSWAPVSKAYKPPFAFNGTINSVEIKLGANKLSAADMKILEEAEKRTSRWNKLNQHPAHRAEHLFGATRRCPKVGFSLVNRQRTWRCDKTNFLAECVRICGVSLLFIIVILTERILPRGIRWVELIVVWRMQPVRNQQCVEKRY
jgi:hypothetical protein